MRRTVRVRVECGVRAGLRADTVKSKLSLNSHGQVSHDDLSLVHWQRTSVAQVGKSLCFHTGPPLLLGRTQLG